MTATDESQSGAVATEAPAKPKLVDPSELTRNPQPLPSKPFTFTRTDKTTMTVLLQGLSYMQKNPIDQWSRDEAAEAARTDVSRVNLWAARILVAAMRKPNGSIAYREEHEIRAQAVAMAEQFSDGQINRAANLVLDLSGQGDDALETAVKP